MRPKDFRKKLVLNKKTVVNLNDGEMKNLNGGELGTGISCTICDSNLSCYIERCMIDFTNDGNTCTDYPTNTLVETCPPLACTI